MDPNHFKQSNVCKCCIFTLVVVLCIFILESVSPGVNTNPFVEPVGNLSSHLKRELQQQLPGGAKIGELVYRGSVHGFNGNAIREKAGGIGSTVVLIKPYSRDMRTLIGGYADVSWPTKLREKDPVTDLNVYV